MSNSRDPSGRKPEAPLTLAREEGGGLPLGLDWLIHLRWVAVLGLVLSLLVAWTLGLVEEIAAPACIVAGLALFNSALFIWRGRALPRQRQRRLEIIATVEIHVDLVALTLLLHYTGGIDNPFAMFYVFQIAIGSILLSTARAILVGISAMALFGGMVVLESSAWLPGHPLMFGTEDASGSPGAHGLLVLIALCLTIAGSIYFLQFVVRKQRRSEALRREHERVAVSRERLARIGEISAGIAHNIRNPLHGTLNCLDLLRAGPLGQEARETLDLMEEALRRMERVTNRLLVLTRDSPLRLALVDASEEIRDALRLAAARIGDKRIQLREELTEDAELLLDPDRFHEALVNILDNAIDACAEKGSGTITVRTHATTEPIEGVCIEIRDSGMGVAEDRIGRVFDPFFTTKAIGEGSGLGLAIARRVVERHGGRIDFESLPGRGTIVRLHLPLPGVIHGESRT